MATSLAVIVAVAGANLGWSSLDHIVGILIGVMIAKMTVSGMWKSGKGLMDFSPAGESSAIRELARGVEGVVEVTDVKTRLVGRKIWVDMEVSIPAGTLLREGLETVGRIKRAVTRRIKNTAEVSVRLSPAR